MTSPSHPGKRTSILIINPNSSTSMTEGMLRSIHLMPPSPVRASSHPHTPTTPNANNPET